MADIALTAAAVAPVFPPGGDGLSDTVIRSCRAIAAITVGQSVYLDPTTGKVGVCDANDAGKEQFRGVALTTVGAGDVVRVLERGSLYGFTIAGMSFDDLVYQSDTAGALSTTAGTKTVQVGRVLSLPDGTKILYVEADFKRTW